jgi:hypothetical protein
MPLASSVRLHIGRYWSLPIGRYASPDPVFTPWQRVEFTRAPAGKKELSALPHGAYYIRYLVRS